MSSSDDFMERTDGSMASARRSSTDGSKGIGGLGLVLWFLVSVTMVVGPFLLPVISPGVPVGTGSALILSALGVVSLILMAVVVVMTKLYQRASANTAFIRTGMGGLKVIHNGGAVVVPVLHRVLPVNLESIKLEVARKGKEGLLTDVEGESLRADIQAEFYIKVPSTQEDIINAGQSLGDKSTEAHLVKQLVFEKLVSAIRTVAAKSTLVNLNKNREQFAKDVKNEADKELRPNGLMLESVTISSLEQTGIDFLNDDNVFDARGRQHIAKVTQAANVQRNEIERNAERDMKLKDVGTRKEVLEMEKDQKLAEAAQGRDVLNAEALAAKEAGTFRIQQSEEVERRELEKDEAIGQRDIEKQKAIEIAEQQKRAAVVLATKAQEVADVEREQAIEVAKVAKVKAEEVARRLQQIAIAEKEEARAKAEAARLAAEAEREQNDQAVKTVETVETAKRAKQQSVISAEAEAERLFVEKQRAADGEAYREKAIADGKKAAAEADYAARVKAAEADQKGAELRAAGLRAEQMVPIQVASEQVKVDRSREMIQVEVAEKRVAVDRQAVAVERQRLEQQEQFSDAALKFELDKLRVEQSARIEISRADAVAKMMASTDMTVYGDPSTLGNMLNQFNSSMRVPVAIDGFLAGLDSSPGAKELVSRVAHSAEDLAKATSDRLSGRKPETQTDGAADAGSGK